VLAHQLLGTSNWGGANQTDVLRPAAAWLSVCLHSCCCTCGSNHSRLGEYSAHNKALAVKQIICKLQLYAVSLLHTHARSLGCGAAAGRYFTVIHLARDDFAACCYVQWREQSSSRCTCTPHPRTVTRTIKQQQLNAAELLRALLISGHRQVYM
jgi:hypothetical protein